MMSCSKLGRWMAVTGFMFPLHACGPGEDPDADPPTSLSLEECSGTLGDERLRCGRLTVPEDWSVPDGPRLILPFLILPALGTDVRPDPIVYLGGGPGPSGLENFAEFSTLRTLRAHRDLIFIEYRGVGVSEPSFPCRSVAEFSEAAFAACWELALAEGMDPAHYNTKNAARDVRALRRALDIDRWNVWGISYGTTTAQLLSDIDGEGTRSVTLDSPTSPSVEIARADLESRLDGFSTIFAACASDPACGDDFVDLKTTLESDFAALSREPWEHGSLTLSATFGSSLDGDAYLRTLSNLHHLQVPAAIDAIGRRDAQRLAEVQSARPFTGLSTPASSGFPAFEALANISFSVSVYCAEEAPYYDLDTRPVQTQEPWPAEIVASPALHLTWESCAGWPTPAAPPSDVDLVRNDIPTLILTGQFDNLTPKRQGEIVQQGLDNSILIDLPNTAHATVPTQPCAESLMADFLENPDAGPDTSCLRDISAPEFLR